MESSLAKGGCELLDTSEVLLHVVLEAGEQCEESLLMGSQQEEEDLGFSAAYEDDTPTPSGWKRKLVPRIGKGMVPARTDVIFITPSGEEFKSRAQLQRYLKANKGSPSLSEFIWIVDGMPQRSTRSKSSPMVERLEILPRAASKRKPDRVTNEVGVGKRRRTGKASLKSEEPRVSKSNHLKNMDIATPVEEKDEGVFAGSSPASAKKKRSVKVTRRMNRGPTVVVTSSANANGVAELSSKDEKADEGANTKNASKRKRSRGRPVGGKKGGVSRDRLKEADVDVNDDNANLTAGATDAQTDANGRGEGDHAEERADVDPNDDMTAASV